MAQSPSIGRIGLNAFFDDPSSNPTEINLAWVVFHNVKKDKNELKALLLGSGFGSVGRAVASDTRDPQFQTQS